MKPDRVHLLREDLSVSGDGSRSDLDALATARARQDLSHQKLEEFIASALAELGDDVRAA